MQKTITISWLKLNSGSYALKGIRIYVNNHAYDSTTTFRDEDAQWLTDVLGARSDVEFSSSNAGGYASTTPEAYPEWARRVQQEPEGEAVHPLDWERASTTLLRHVLAQLVETCENGGDAASMEQVTKEAKAALLATQTPVSHYSLHEARNIIEKPAQKLAKVKGKR
jgi:hypothetical protein